MVRCLCSVFLIVIILLLPSALRAEENDGITAEQVNNAIDRGVAYLQSQQHPRQGNWTEQPGYAAGMTALCTLALLESGVDPADEDIQRALDYLRNLDMPERTYGVALQTMALCAAEPEKDMLLILRNARYIESMQRTEGPMKGAWGYDQRQGGGDHSNTQFAMLALYEADRASLRVTGDAIASPQTWRLAAKHWTESDQNGAWGYQEGGQVSGSMTCAGVASLVMAMSRSSVDASVETGQVRCCGEGLQDDPLQDDAYRTIQLGQEWLGRHYATDRNPGGHSWRLYYLYAAERVGRMTGQRFFGTHDWYREMARSLVRDQDRFTGAWTSHGTESNPTLGTALAILALSKGRRPVVISKLEWPGADNDWNRHRNDVQNLTRYVESRWEMRLSWQTIKIDTASVQDLLQTPVLYITGRDSLDLTAEQKENLKKYVEQGGFLFASGSAGGEFDSVFRELMKEIFPDSQLRKLPPDHAVWYAEEPIDLPELPEVWGLDACCRTSVVYVPAVNSLDLSCYLELAHEGGFADYPESIQDRIEGMRGLAANILAYATNRQLHDKLDIPLYREGDGAETPARGTLFVAKVMHGGGGDDAPAALSNMLRELAAHSEQRVSTERRLLQADEEDLADYPILFMHGRRNFQFSPVEVGKLRDFVEHGGVVFSDAICASEAFGTSFRGLVREMFPEGRMERIPPDHALFTDAFRGFDLDTVMLRDPEARQRDDPLHARLRRISPVLEGLEIDGRYVIIFSPYDLSCAMESGVSLDCKGYNKEDAARLATNILLYSLQQ